MHDVDLVMEDERNLYYCNPKLARHISAGIDKYNYELPYDGLFGGVVALTKDQFEKINGYSNEYWGWGCEDDDMFIRVVHSCVGLEHVMHDDAHYKMIFHPHDRENSINSNRFYKLIHAKERQFIDGYNQVEGLYNVVKVSYKEHMYTNITIDVGEYRDPNSKDQDSKEISNKNGDTGETEGAQIINNNPGPDNFQEDYAVDVQVLIVVFLLILYSLYKSRFLVYLYKKNQRAKHHRSDRKRRTKNANSISKNNRNFSNDTNNTFTTNSGSILSSDEFSSEGEGVDEKPLIGKGKTHTRTQSMPLAGDLRRK